jgi:hypothetical protein
VFTALMLVASQPLACTGNTTVDAVITQHQLRWLTRCFFPGCMCDAGSS